MKIIQVDKKGNESHVCESIDNFHGLIFVKLMNGNYSTQNREVKYKLVEDNYVMNDRQENKDWEQLEIPFYDGDYFKGEGSI